jgi:choline dehydrogenase-like flavoprotein
MANQIIYDVIVVGSGATGGWAAKELTQKGLRVAVLEAGRKLDPITDYTEHTWPYELPFRGFGNQREMARTKPIQSRCYACTEYGQQFFVNDLEHPYTTPPDKPFFWIRSRHVGGRSIPWGRFTWRLSDYDFKAASRDGFGEDWPISYAEIAPYYDRVEDFIGVSGATDGLPQVPDGRFLPPMPMTCGELPLKRAVERMGDPLRRVISARAAVLTRPIHQGTPDARAACHWCDHCGRGCTSGSYFSSPASTLPAAARTGRMTLITHAIANNVIVDKNTGRAKGIRYIDALSRQDREVFGKVVMLCAGTLESTRILLNSAPTEGGDQGLCNSSGVLGHYLMDHVKDGGASGSLPKMNSKTMEQDGRPNGIYIPRFYNLTTRRGDFLRGFGLQGGAGQSLYQHAKSTPGFGQSFKSAVRDRHPWGISLKGYGECLPRYENHVRLNRKIVDAWGIPVLHIDMAWSDNELKQVVAMGDAAEEIFRAAGVEDIRVIRQTDSPPGFSIHEVGTARMGNDPKKSVLNKFNQAHDIKNLFVTDGACYVSIGCQNPTLTMMALTVRACDYLIEELRASRL